mmetsp:Transcript_12334/g.23592  ORF Transcript_12334/g.23592 Transcript_12334/m.23592 type:complete len:181 (-) Transcript_12334:163-705(-)
MMMMRFSPLFLLLVHCLFCLVVSSDVAQNIGETALSTGGNLRLGDTHQNNKNVFEEHRRMVDQQCTVEGIGACVFQENGEYYKDCGESDYWGADIIFKTKSDMWCFSDELDRDICCGDAMDCCDIRWWIAAFVFVGLSILLSICCCGLCILCNRCCSSKKRAKTPKPEQPTDDDADENSS